MEDDKRNEEKQEDQEICVICHEFRDNQRTGKLNCCDHRFCYECIVQWFDSYKRTCPLDRKTFSYIELYDNGSLHPNPYDERGIRSINENNANSRNAISRNEGPRNLQYWTEHHLFSLSQLNIYISSPDTPASSSTPLSNNQYSLSTSQEIDSLPNNSDFQTDQSDTDERDPALYNYLSLLSGRNPNSFGYNQDSSTSHGESVIQVDHDNRQNFPDSPPTLTQPDISNSSFDDSAALRMYNHVFPTYNASYPSYISMFNQNLHVNLNSSEYNADYESPESPTNNLPSPSYNASSPLSNHGDSDHSYSTISLPEGLDPRSYNPAGLTYNLSSLLDNSIYLQNSQNDSNSFEFIMDFESSNESFFSMSSPENSPSQPNDSASPTYNFSSPESPLYDLDSSTDSELDSPLNNADFQSDNSITIPESSVPQPQDESNVPDV